MSLIWLHRYNGDQWLPIRERQSHSVETRLFGAETMTFTVKADDQRAEYLNVDQIVSFEGVRYKLVETTQERIREEAVVICYCEALWNELGQRIRVGNFNVLGQQIGPGLTQILSGTGWTVGTLATDLNVYSIEDNDAPVLALVRRWAGVTNKEVRFNTADRTVDLVDTVGVTRPIGFRYGRNMTSVKRRYQPPLATRLYPFGANSLDITGPNPTALQFIEDYSWYTAQGLTLAEAKALYRKDQVWIDERYLVAINLYDAALARLAAIAQPIVSYETSVADLSTLTGSSEDDFEVGDTVRVFDAEFGLDLPTRVVRLVRYPLEPWSNQVELDYSQAGLGDETGELDQRDLGYDALKVLVSSNDAAVDVNSSSVFAWATVEVTTTGSATTAVLGGTFTGTATGTGTIEVYCTLDGVDIGPRKSIAFVAGQVEHSWPTFTADVPEGPHTIQWRATRSAGTGNVLLPIDGGRGWVLITGGVGVGLASSPSAFVSEEVDPIVAASVTDVYTVLIEANDIIIVETEAPTQITPYVPGEDWNIPFTLDDATFGVLDSQYKLSGPAATY